MDRMLRFLSQTDGRIAKAIVIAKKVIRHIQVDAIKEVRQGKRWW